MLQTPSSGSFSSTHAFLIIFSILVNGNSILWVCSRQKTQESSLTLLFLVSASIPAAMLSAPPSGSMQTPSRSSTSVALTLAKPLSPPAGEPTEFGSHLVSGLCSWPPIVFSQHSSWSDIFFFFYRLGYMCSNAFPSGSSQSQSSFYGLCGSTWSALGSPPLWPPLLLGVTWLCWACSPRAPLQGLSALALSRRGAVPCPESCRICSSPPTGSLLTCHFLSEAFPDQIYFTLLSQHSLPQWTASGFFFFFLLALFTSWQTVCCPHLLSVFC